MRFFQRLTVCIRFYLYLGQGRHSENGVQKLRPALEKLFDEYVERFFITHCFLTLTTRRRLRHSLDPGNAGKLIVYLD